MSGSLRADLSVFRQLMRHLKQIYSPRNVRDTPVYKYITDQYRAHQVTGAKHCKQQHEMRYLAEAYLCLLESNAKQAQLTTIYKRGERSIKDSASLVGLRLPADTDK